MTILKRTLIRSKSNARCSNRHGFDAKKGTEFGVGHAGATD
jgi:hypothetical protein